MDMKKVAFGNSDLEVSKIGLGLAALGRPGYINLGHSQDLAEDYAIKKMEKVTHQMLDQSIRLGINYFDVARSYGKGEEFFSSWYGRENEKVVVGSKWGYYYTAQWQVKADQHEVKEHSVELLAQQWPKSLALLSSNLRIYHIHSATFESGVLDNHQVLESLEEIRQKGIIIGLSLSGKSQSEVLEKALDIRVGDKPLFGSVQATYNILEQSAAPTLRRAYDNGLGVIIKESVANGRLTSRNTRAPYYQPLKTMASNYETTIDALAMAFVLSQPFVTTVLSGASTLQQLNSNAKATSVSLAKSDLEIIKGMAMDTGNYWQERSDLTWN